MSFVNVFKSSSDIDVTSCESWKRNLQHRVEIWYKFQSRIQNSVLFILIQNTVSVFLGYVSAIQRVILLLHGYI